MIKIDKWTAICLIAFFAGVVGLSYIDKHRDYTPEYIAELKDYQKRLEIYSDSLQKSIEGQVQIQRYILIMKHDIDSLKSRKQ